jgi:predicted O-methyltransferase YrrM
MVWSSGDSCARLCAINARAWARLISASMGTPQSTMSDAERYRTCLALMESVVSCRHQPIHRRLRKFGARQSMLHLDALLLVYHLARVCRGSILEIGAFRGGSTIAAAWGMREATESKKLITIEPGGRLRKHRLATRNILRSLKRNLTRQGVAGGVSVIEGHSFETQVIATVDRLLERAQVGLLILDADADCKRDIDRYGPKLMPGCWLVIDDYLGSADNTKASPTKIQVDQLAAEGRLAPLGCFGLGTWVGQWA